MTRRYRGIGIIPSMLRLRRPFQMAAGDHGQQNERIVDPEFLKLAESLAKADMLSVAAIGRSLYEASDARFSGPEDSTSMQFVHERVPDHMQAWSCSIQAFVENGTIPHWVSRHPTSIGQVSKVHLREVISTKDDDWSRKWSEVIQQITSDYNSITYKNGHFHRRYLGDSEFETLWLEVFTAAMRMETMPRTTARWVEELRCSIGEAGAILEDLIVQSVREVDRPIRRAIKARAVAIERVREQMLFHFPKGRFSIWREPVWSDTWAMRERRCEEAMAYNSHRQNKGSGRTTLQTLTLPRRLSEIGPTTLNATTAVVFVLSSIPAMVAWSCSQSESGNTADGDFWWLLPSVLFQLLALATLSIPMLASKPVQTSGRRWAWACISAGVAITVSAIPLYLRVSVRYSSAAMFLSNVVIAFIHVQVSLIAMSLVAKDKQE